MIHKSEYEASIQQRDAAIATINAYLKEQIETIEQRVKDNTAFAEDELRYAAFDRCPCGHGLAYPKKCGINHYWDCSAILKGIADPSVQHTARLPFAFYEIKSEDQPSAQGATTRPKA